MNRTERFYKIDKLLQARRSTPISTLMSELEVSKSTIKRDLTYMRDRLDAPIVWDSDSRGYRYTDPLPGSPRFSLPGLWFNSSELHALLTMEHLLGNLQPGFLSEHIDPLRHRVKKILRTVDQSVEELTARIRIVPGTIPPANPAVFQQLADALLRRVQVNACYRNKIADESKPRCISPQRLVYYREKWYLDGWCHSRNGLRTFRLSNLTDVEVTDTAAVDIEEQALDDELKAGFGIFGGSSTQQATLRFSADISGWIMHENWHSEQAIQLDDQARLVLSFPYSNDPELIMKILSYGSDVEVLKPLELRRKVANAIRRANDMYR
ncbi:MAG: YafY family protein [Acidiferrobacterales bacterium]|nr:YafY family protein [Acidiferrobacterales bacterium]